MSKREKLRNVEEKRLRKENGQAEKPEKNHFDDKKNRQQILFKYLLLNIIGYVIAGNNIMEYSAMGTGYFTALCVNGYGNIGSVMVFAAGMFKHFEQIAAIRNIMIVTVIYVLYQIMKCAGINIREISGMIMSCVVMSLLCIGGAFMNKGGISAFGNENVEFKNSLFCIMLVSVATAVIMYIFNRALMAIISRKTIYSNEDMFAVAIFLGVIVYILGTQYAPPASITEILMFAAVIFGAYKYGAGMGAIMGASMGVALSLWKNNAECLGIMCMVGIMAGVFRELGRLICALSVISTCVTVGYVAIDIFKSPEMIKGVSGAAVAFMLIPKYIAYRVDESQGDSIQEKFASACDEKLKSIARAFEKMSVSMGNRLSNDSQSNEKINGNEDAVNKIWKNKFEESRNVMSDQLMQVSKIIEDYSKEVYNFVKISDRETEYIRHRLNSRKVYMEKIAGIENKRHKKEFLVTAKCDHGMTIGTREVAEIISEAMGRTYMPSRNCRKVLSSEYTTTTYVEKANFYVLHGAARKARGGSGISGDNYSFQELDNGQMLMSLSDGMGYGTSACIESETVIELLEQLLDSGFDEETSLKMINSIMVMNSAEEHPATLDFGVIDLHTGVCDLVKIGAASTFVKRGKWVESIKSTSMPLGMLGDVDYDQISKKLYDGDMVIMVSDGVLDAIECEDRDEELSRIIMNMESNNPKEIANKILEMAVRGTTKMSDDMTVLVTGIWDNRETA